LFAIQLERLVDLVRGPQQCQLAQGGEVADPEVVPQGRVDLLGGVDVAVRHTAAKRFWRHVDQLDLFGSPDNGVRDPLPLRDPGDFFDHVVEGFQMLNVDRGDHVDARGQEHFDVLPALLVARPGHVGMRKLVDQGHRGVAGQDRVQVHLRECAFTIGDLAARNHLQPLEQLSRMPPAVGLDVPDDDVRAALGATTALIEHGVGLPDAGGSAQVDPQLAAPHGSSSPHSSTSFRDLSGRRHPAPCSVPGR
jgi:hypothetical protein